MAEGKEIREAIGDSARRKLGVNGWDRPRIYREAAESGTDNRAVYWSVLLLSGAIATLGLALDSSAVVIGAMLVAPLLAPVLGLALALAVGDGRLSVQTAAIVLGSTVGVILVSAGLTAVLPFHTITLEISARTRPTTLDLAVAVFSGLVGAVVMVARRSRLSAAIPGVAIAVALIPPLAVAGFGVGIGRADLVRGSLLLYGANLAGIVLSGMAVFLLIGMHRPEVLQTARDWHRQATFRGIAAWMNRVHWIRTLGVFQAPWARVALVLVFVVALGFPLSETLAQIARETRIERAITETERALFHVPGRASVLDRQIVFGPDRVQVYVRVATTEWFGSTAREDFERNASAAAGEPVRLTLEQLPARGEDLDQLRRMFPGQDARPSTHATPVSTGELLGSVRARLEQATAELALPTDVAIVGKDVTIRADGGAAIGIAYAAPEPLQAQAESMLRGQLDRALGVPDLGLRLRHISTESRAISAGVDDPVLAELVDSLREHPALIVEVLAPAGQESGEQEALVERLRARGIDAYRISVGTGADDAVRARLRVGVQHEPPG